MKRWQQSQLEQVPYRLLCLCHRQRPLCVNLSAMFNCLGKTLRDVLRADGFVHCFINRSQLVEAHYVTASTSTPPETCLYRRIGSGVVGDGAETQSARWLRELLPRTQGADLDVPAMAPLREAEFVRLRRVIGMDETADARWHIRVPFDYDPKQLDLGQFVFWGERQSPSMEEVQPWLATYYKYMCTLLKREYDAGHPDTYLPSFMATRWYPAAVLCADIRNFTPLTEIIRHSRGISSEPAEVQGLCAILNRFSQEMAEIVHRVFGGRVDSLIGDGLVAVFGEHAPDPVVPVGQAVGAATRMVKRFAQSSEDLLNSALGCGHEVEFNDGIDIDLGVGINYGTVLFDYLGDDRHRQYTVVGDHVNFAKRLLERAARPTENPEELSPRILLSRTVERCIRPWLDQSKVKEIRFRVAGKAFPQVAFGIEADAFRTEDFLAVLEMPGDRQRAEIQGRFEGCGGPPVSPSAIGLDVGVQRMANPHR